MHRSQVLLALSFFCAYVLRLAYAQVFDVIEYGAKGDGLTDDTKAVRAALAAAAANGGGEVLFAKQHSFLTGAINITSNVILNVKGTILASKLSEGYELVPPIPWYPGGSYVRQAVVYSYYASNITITGGGIIDGQGAIWWACGGRDDDVNGPFDGPSANTTTGPPCLRKSRPELVKLMHSRDILLYDITLKDSAFWTLHPANCTNVHIDRVTILAPTNSPNTDGIDIDCSVNVLVENSYYSGGDDAIAVKSGRDYNGRMFGRTTENVVIRNMTIGSCRGLSVGSEMSGGVRNVTFHHITILGGQIQGKNQRGVNIKSQRGRGGIVEDITFSNIIMHNVVYAIEITLNYHQNLHQTNATATPQFRNFTIHNIASYGANNGWYLDGLPESYIHNVSFSNIQLYNTSHLIEKCNYIYGTCDQSSVLPSCPPCLQ